MRQNQFLSKRLSVEQLEDRCLLAVADPAIAFVAARTAQGSPVYDLTVMNADGSNQTVIWSRAEQIIESAWSPDADGDSANGYQGTLAVVVQSGTSYPLYLVDVRLGNGVPTGANIRLLVDPAIDPHVGNGAYSSDWSPDLDPLTPGYQGSIAFLGWTDGVDNVNTGSINIIAMAYNGSTLEAANGPNSSTVLVEGHLTNETLFNPTWSPTGDRLAFRADSPGPSDTRLAVVNVVGGAASGQVTVLSGYSVSSFHDLDWSRSGSQVAYATRTSPEKLYVVDVVVGGSSLQEVPGAKYSNRSPSWSPDDPATAIDETDKFIVFAGKDKVGQKSSIRRVDLATNLNTIVASNAKADLVWPDWRPFLTSNSATSTAAATDAALMLILTDDPILSNKRK